VKADVQEIKRSVNLVEYIQGKGIKLRRQGKGFVGLCPFHGDKKPSFTVDPEKSLWHCFGCGKGGDLFTFLQELEKLTFTQALSQVRGNGDTPGHRSHENMNQNTLLAQVAAVYHQAFYDDSRARDYLGGRGLKSPELYTSFRLGFANGTLMAMVPQSGECVQSLKEIGILTSSGAEFFHNHLVVPLYDEDGTVTGMYGRSIDNASRSPHRYLKGPHRGLFNSQAAKRSREIFLTESIIDALSLYQAGFTEVIPLYGVNGLTDDHLSLFKKHMTNKITLVLDNDPAGSEACPRIAGALSPIECRKVLLPAKDANEFFRTGTAEEFIRLCETAEPVIVAPGPTSTTQDDCRKESTDEGFLLVFPLVSYQVKILPTGDERLRVTVRASAGEKVFLDTLDLYSHRSRQSAITHISKLCSLSREKVEAHFLVILDEAEKLAREKALKDRENANPTAPVMSDHEREEALSFLTSPSLVQEIVHDMEILGYAGEDSNKLLAYLIGISRKLEKPLSGIISSSSGAGKSHLAELVESLTPPEDVILFSRLSPQALGYMEKDFLKRKLLVIEERCGSESADYSIRTLQSRQKLTQGVVIKDPSSGRMYTKTYTVEGPIAYLETTTSGMVNPENSTRCFELSLDESREQTRKVQEMQKAARTLIGREKKETGLQLTKKHQNAQRLLSPCAVVIPYAPLIEFPSEWLRTRRDNERFLCLIEAISFLHQHQREVKRAGENDEAVEYIEATVDDYRLAYDLAKDVLSQTLHDLKKHSRELLDELMVMTRASAAALQREPHEIAFSRRDIREYTSWSDRKVRECLSQLVDLEYVYLVGGGSQGKQCAYQLPERIPDPGFSIEALTSVDQLKEKMHHA